MKKILLYGLILILFNNISSMEDQKPKVDSNEEANISILIEEINKKIDSEKETNDILQAEVEKQCLATKTLLELDAALKRARRIFKEDAKNKYSNLTAIEFKQKLIHLLNIDPITKADLKEVIQIIFGYTIIDIQNADGYTTLMKAVNEGDIDYVRILLENGADVNIQNKAGDNALMIAADKGYIEIVRLLIAEGAEVNVKGVVGTALMKAALKGHTKIVELLIDNGADVNIDKYGNTALNEAAKEGHAEIVKLLIDNGADVNIKIENVFGWGALFHAVCGDYVEVVKLLIDNIDNTDDIDRCKPVLIVANLRGNAEIINYLHKHNKS